MIAKTINDVWRKYAEVPDEKLNRDALMAISDVVGKFADNLEIVNPRFNRDLFWEACHKINEDV